METGMNWYDKLATIATRIEELSFQIAAGEGGPVTRSLYRKYKKSLKTHWATAGIEDLAAACLQGQKDFPDDASYWVLPNLIRNQKYHQRTFPRSMVQ